jgi:hypothetical protein
MIEETNKTAVESRIEGHLKEHDRMVPLRQSYLEICIWDKGWIRESKRKYAKRRDTHSALMLQQLIYWSGRANPKNKGWIAKSAKQWQEEVGLTESEVKSAQSKLKRLGYIETRTGPFMAKNTTWYRIMEGTITDALDRLLEIQDIEPEDQDMFPEVQDRRPVIEEL